MFHGAIDLDPRIRCQTIFSFFNHLLFWLVVFAWTHSKTSRTTFQISKHMSAARFASTLDSTIPTPFPRIVRAVRGRLELKAPKIHESWIRSIVSARGPNSNSSRRCSPSDQPTVQHPTSSQPGVDDSPADQSKYGKAKGKTDKAQTISQELAEVSR